MQLVVFCDLDGVVWLDRRSIPVSVAAVAEYTSFCLSVFEAPMPEPAGSSVTLSSYRRPTLESAPVNAKAACLYPNSGRALLEATEPWKAEPGPEVDGVLGDALEVLRLVCILASPALTRATEVAWQRIGLAGSPAEQRLPEAAAWGGYPGGLAVEKGDPLFPRLKA